jgi:hypothetical protein
MWGLAGTDFFAKIRQECRRLRQQFSEMGIGGQKNLAEIILFFVTKRMLFGIRPGFVIIVVFVAD